MVQNGDRLAISQSLQRNNSFRLYYIQDVNNNDYFVAGASI